MNFEPNLNYSKASLIYTQLFETFVKNIYSDEGLAVFKFKFQPLDVMRCVPSISYHDLVKIQRLGWEIFEILYRLSWIPLKLPILEAFFKNISNFIGILVNLHFLLLFFSKIQNFSEIFLPLLVIFYFSSTLKLLIYNELKKFLKNWKNDSFFPFGLFFS